MKRIQYVVVLSLVSTFFVVACGNSKPAIIQSIEHTGGENWSARNQDACMQKMAANVVVGLLCIGKEMREHRTERLVLSGKTMATLFSGVPERIRPYFSDSVDAEGVPSQMKSLTFEATDDHDIFQLTWIYSGEPLLRKKLSKRYKFSHHKIQVYFSRDTVMKAKLRLSGIIDPRVDAQAGHVKYDVVQQGEDIFGSTTTRAFRVHPWQEKKAFGFTDIEGLSMQLYMYGAGYAMWHKDAQRAVINMPIVSYFTYSPDLPSSDQWISYREFRGDNSKFKMRISTFKRDFTQQRAFVDYFSVPEHRYDKWTAVNLSQEAGAVSRDREREDQSQSQSQMKGFDFFLMP